MIYGKKNGGHREFKRVKSLRSSQSDCLFALSHFRRDLGPQLSHDATCFHIPFLVENVCAFSIVFTFVVCDA